LVGSPADAGYPDSDDGFAAARHRGPGPRREAVFRVTCWGAYETLDYLKEGPAIIRQLVPQARVVGLVYNPAEPQSVLALEVIRKACAEQD